MKTLKPSEGNNAWPRKAVASVETRKRDLVIRISDWTRESIKSGEPGYDVEVYVGGIYDWNLSECFTLSSGLTKKEAKEKAIQFAQKQIETLL